MEHLLEHVLSESLNKTCPSFLHLFCRCVNRAKGLVWGYIYVVNWSFLSFADVLIEQRGLVWGSLYVVNLSFLCFAYVLIEQRGSFGDLYMSLTCHSFVLQMC